MSELTALMQTMVVKMSTRTVALRAVGTCTGLAGVVCALTVLHTVWTNADWSASYLRNSSYYGLDLPDNGAWLLLFGYLGFPLLGVLYRLARLPVGPRVMPLAIGAFCILQACWIARPFVDGTEESTLHAVVGGALSAGPLILVGAGIIVVFIRFPEGLPPRRQKTRRRRGPEQAMRTRTIGRYAIVLHVAAAATGLLLGTLLFHAVSG